MNKMKKYLLGFFFLLILIIGLVVASQLTQEKQEIRKRASTPSGTALVSLSPASGNYEVGQSFPVSVYFNPVSIPISSIAVRITYPLSGNLTASSLQINPSFLTSGNWMCPVKTITPTGSQVEIDIACANITTEGFTAASDTLLASFNLVANEVPAVNPVVLSFDPAASKIMSKAQNQDILLTPPAAASYTINLDLTPPAAITNLNITNVSFNSLSLSWTAPADAGPAGKANLYDLRYSTSVITNTNWSSATPVSGLPIPGNPGKAETFTVSGLNPGTKYYFAIKSIDTAGNISNLSNIAEATTNAPTLSFGFRMQGINQQGISKSIRVTLKGPSGQVYPSVICQSGAHSSFAPVNPISLANLSFPAGGVNVEVLVKDNGHLQKKLGNITLTASNNQASASWNSIEVKSGDFNNDNQLDIDDVGAVIGVYTALSVPVSASNQQFDVNANSFIEIDDISAVLLNYTALTVLGDQ